MSTVAYRDGVMAGDKKVSYHSGQVTKVFKIETGEREGWLVGLSGEDLGSLMLWKDWFEDLRDDPPSLEEMGKYNIMAVSPEGQIYLYLSNSPVTIEDAYFAVGSGSDYAMGALHAGASAEEAVHIAGIRDQHTGVTWNTVQLK